MTKGEGTLTTSKTDIINMTDEELKKLIRRNPKSIISQAYRLGRKDISLEFENATKKKLTVPVDKC
jgi:hypothetical protein